MGVHLTSGAVSTCHSAQPGETAHALFAGNAQRNGKVPVVPLLVAQINFQESTPDGHLRHSRFAGLREDKEARKVVREQ